VTTPALSLLRVLGFGVGAAIAVVLAQAPSASTTAVAVRALATRFAPFFQQNKMESVSFSFCFAWHFCTPRQAVGPGRDDGEALKRESK